MQRNTIFLSSHVTLDEQRKPRRWTKKDDLTLVLFEEFMVQHDKHMKIEK